MKTDISRPNHTSLCNRNFKEGGMKKKILLFVFLIMPAFPYAIFADGLVLVKGKDVPVCEAHYKNLKAMDPRYVEGMVCERDKYYPEQNGITRPKWEEMDLKENMELVKKIKKFLDEGDQFTKRKMYDDEKEYESYLELILRIGDAMYFTNVDINNDGKPEKIILYNDARCMYTHVYARSLLVWDEDEKLIDVKETEPLLQNPFPRDIKAKAVNHLYQIYDLFLYKNTTYFDRWNIRDWTLSVYIQSEGKTKEVCNYKYKRMKNKGGKQ